MRPLDKDGAEKLRILRNRNARSFLDSNQITEDAQRAWYKAYLAKPNDYMFSVHLAGMEQWIGAVGIYGVNQELKTAEFGRLLIDKSATKERGLGLDTTLTACRFAFEQLGLEAVYLDVYADNIPAVRTYMKAGFSIIQENFGDDGRAIQRMVLKK